MQWQPGLQKLWVFSRCFRLVPMSVFIACPRIQRQVPFEDHPAWKGGHMRPLLRREPGSKEVLPEFWQAGWANQLWGGNRRLCCLHFFPRLIGIVDFVEVFDASKIDGFVETCEEVLKVKWLKSRGDAKTCKIMEHPQVDQKWMQLISWTDFYLLNNTHVVAFNTVQLCFFNSRSFSWSNLKLRLVMRNLCSLFHSVLACCLIFSMSLINLSEATHALAWTCLECLFGDKSSRNFLWGVNGSMSERCLPCLPCRYMLLYHSIALFVSPCEASVSFYVRLSAKHALPDPPDPTCRSVWKWVGRGDPKCLDVSADPSRMFALKLWLVTNLSRIQQALWNLSEHLVGDASSSGGQEKEEGEEKDEGQRFCRNKPSREQAYPQPRHFWRWVSFSEGGMC